MPELPKMRFAISKQMFDIFVKFLDIADDMEKDSAKAKFDYLPLIRLLVEAVQKLKTPVSYLAV